MLVLSRKPGESIVIGDDIIIEVARITPPTIDLAITAPPWVRRLLVPEYIQVPADQEVISRHCNESLQLGGDIQIFVVDIRKNDKVRLGIDCPRGLAVRRRD